MPSLRFARESHHDQISPPPIHVRYFYTSPLAIDDPLSAIPPPASSSTTAHRGAPRPFSTFDNATLEKTWLEVRQRIIKQAEDDKSEKRRSRSGTAGSSAGTVRGQASINPARRPPTIERKRSFGPNLSPSDSPIVRPRSIPSSDGLGSRRGNGSTSGDASVASSYRANADIPEGSLPAIESTSVTGNPFIRAPARLEAKNQEPIASRANSVRPTARMTDSYNWGEDTFQPSDAQRDKSIAREAAASKVTDTLASKVPVGVSRLHNVKLPNLQMEPIYWLPVGDIAPVLRGTWFYYDNMLPVETEISNLLEAGYVSLQAWTDTWKDELNSAIEVGASGEMKIIHKLWPEKAEAPASRPPTIRELGSVQVETILEDDQVNPEKEQQEIAATAGDLIDISTAALKVDHKAAGVASWGRDGSLRQYKTAGIIYANEKEAYILRPNLQPSNYYGRRPLANYIRKNRDIGIKVVRGFDQQRWDRLHPIKQGPKAKKAREGVSSSEGGISAETRQLFDSSLAQSERPGVTDLVLVIHGIGQKLSERVENYHFTHAINTFRRDINVELGDDAVKANLRQELGGIMVLPVNWRLTLSFEDGGYRDESDTSLNSYSLKDVTPATLPAVRNIVSDVMLDIPYYLTPGYHDKMVDAVVREANRIYHLWCVNNPGFAEHGKVHLIAHSLGSVMAIDILSSQPTRIELPKPVHKLALTDLPTTHFAFDVHNLFLAGSPTGFFLLLKNSGLLPRRGRPKPEDHDDYDYSDDAMPGVTGEVGTYGCLPVDNIYNVVNPYDPVAYCLNAAVDANYAAALKQALIPSASKPWLSFSLLSSSSNNPPVSTSNVLKPLTQRLPSTVELETHNFTREEIAERKAFLLNDNGQIDFFLRYGGGALEIQYLTMLGAHSSYWVNRDFVRMLVTEIGRRPGRAGTLHAMRAVKKKKV